ncbi:hypothetical protein ACTQYZ_02560 [Anaerofustis sp. LCP19S3_F7]|uniref:hypothetical protein n=1 Tax=Anaerofustis sp. LCP19S3_F7 TaxID=3440247 RepID=UPI003F8F394A
MFIGAFLLKSNVYVSMEHLSNKLSTSISTITKDLLEIEKWFKNRNVSLIKKAGKGIK